MDEETKKTYDIQGIVSADDVPNWSRREPKWDELVQAVMQLEPGKSLVVAFPNTRTAERARNAIRDNVNLKFAEKAKKGGKAPLVRTRIAHEKGDKVLAYFTMTEGEFPGEK